MKYLLTLVLSFLLFTLSYGQNIPLDIVYLKHRQKIKGIIIDNKPPNPLKIKTDDNKVHILERDDIIKIIDIKNEKKYNKRGYIGITIGYNNPVSLYESLYIRGNGYEEIKPGIQLNYINFGYLLIKSFGISGSFYSGNNSFEYRDQSASFDYKGLSIGPMYRFVVKDKYELDFRSLIGFSYNTLPDIIGNGDETSISIAESLGFLFRAHLNDNFSAMVGFDSYITRQVFDDTDFIKTIDTITLTFGLALRL